MTQLTRCFNYREYLERENEPRSQRLTKLLLLLVSDLDSSDKYYFDQEEAEKAIKFAELIARYEGVELADFQKFILASIYGWRRRDNDLKRFRNIYISLGRKNTKSFLSSIISLYELLYGESQPTNRQIYIAANSMRQAQNLFDMAKNNVNHLKRASAHARNNLENYAKKITYKHSKSFIEVITNARKLDGLNVSCFILDEYSMSPTNEMRDVLVSSQMLQKSPLNIIVSTHSMELSYPWLATEIPMIDSILNGETPFENYLPIFYELDNENEINNETMWLKANPLLEKLGSSGYEYLRSELQRAKASKDVIPVYVKNFNLIVKQSASALYSYQDYSNNIHSFSLGACKGLDAYVGVDLSYTNDLTSVIFNVIKGEKVLVFPFNFVVELDDYPLTERARIEGVNYSALEQQGQVIVCQDRINSIEVGDLIVDVIEQYGLHLKGIYFDGALSSSFIEKLTSEGYGDYLNIVRQGAFTLSPATQSFGEFLRNGRVKFQENELMKNALINVREKRVNDALFFDKGKNRQKIDSYAAMINCWTELPFADYSQATEEKLTTWKF